MMIPSKFIGAGFNSLALTTSGLNTLASGAIALRAFEAGATTSGLVMTVATGAELYLARMATRHAGYYAQAMTTPRPMPFNKKRQVIFPVARAFLSMAVYKLAIAGAVAILPDELQQPAQPKPSVGQQQIPSR